MNKKIIKKVKAYRTYFVDFDGNPASLFSLLYFRLNFLAGDADLTPLC